MSRTLGELPIVQTTIYGQDLTSNKGGRGQKEVNGVGDFFRLAGALHRSGVNHGLHARVDVMVKRDHAGRNGVDRNLRREGFREGFSEHDDAGFRSAVVGMFGPRADAAK